MWCWVNWVALVLACALALASRAGPTRPRNLYAKPELEETGRVESCADYLKDSPEALEVAGGVVAGPVGGGGGTGAAKQARSGVEELKAAHGGKDVACGCVRLVLPSGSACKADTVVPEGVYLTKAGWEALVRNYEALRAEVKRLKGK